MTTTRRPRGRKPTDRITPHAIEIFKRMSKLDCQCDVVVALDDAQCAGCHEFDRLDGKLRDELKLVPWQWPTLIDPDEPESVYSPSSAGALWHPRGQRLFERLVKLSGVTEFTLR